MPESTAGDPLSTWLTVMGVMAFVVFVLSLWLRGDDD